MFMQEHNTININHHSIHLQKLSHFQKRSLIEFANPSPTQRRTIFIPRYHGNKERGEKVSIGDHLGEALASFPQSNPNAPKVECNLSD